jgi:hypothetical protein
MWLRFFFKTREEKGERMMKKAFFAVLSVIVMALTVAPVQSAEWEYVYVTFMGDSDCTGGYVPFNLFMKYQNTGTSVNMEATLLQNEDTSQPVALTGGGDLEPDGTIKSFNLQGTSSGMFQYFTFDFDFNIVASEAKLTTVQHSQALNGGWNETTCNFYGNWDFRFCLNN